jgi:hypothetical protein
MAGKPASDSKRFEGNAAPGSTPQMDPKAGNADQFISFAIRSA